MHMVLYRGRIPTGIVSSFLFKRKIKNASKYFNLNCRDIENALCNSKRLSPNLNYIVALRECGDGEVKIVIKEELDFFR